jgi:hypothetical protein
MAAYKYFTISPAYTDPQTDRTATVIKPTRIDIDYQAQVGRITLCMWKDVADLNASKAPVGPKIQYRYDASDPNASAPYNAFPFGTDAVDGADEYAYKIVVDDARANGSIAGIDFNTGDIYDTTDTIIP